jgi:hypothetical protein
MKRNYGGSVASPGAASSNGNVVVPQSHSKQIPIENYKMTSPIAKGGSLDIHQYSFKELLEVFDLNSNLTLEDLKRTRRQVLSLHPDKNRSVSIEHYMFFKGAYELIESYYKTIKKQNAELPSEEIKYEPFNEKNATIDSEIAKLNKNEFNKKFNEMYENNVMPKNNEIDEERLKWFRDETNNNDKYEKEVKTAKDLNTTFDKIRNSKSGLVIYNGEYRGIGSSNRIVGQSFYDENETDDNGYITCNPFDKLKYDDIVRVHRDQPIIAVETEEFNRATRRIDEYKKAPEIVMMEKEQAEKQLKEQALLYEQRILEKKHLLENKINKYEKLNNELLSQFLLLK